MKKLPDLKTICFIGLTVFLTGILSAAPPVGQKSAVETCVQCHEDMAEGYTKEVHAVIDIKDMAAGYNADNSCAVCHADWEKHLEDGGGTDNILAFKATDIPNTKNQRCLQCHSHSNSRFMASAHGKSALDCTTCHVIHTSSPKPALLRTAATKTCYGCHEGIFAQFQLNERHRLQEGILSCATCHDPHEPSSRERLGGFKHQACLNCHMDKGGPFLYEHGASQIEGCTACHEVHGSPNRHMLTHQSISDLCFSCHTFAPSWHSRFTHDTSNCTSCHSTIHGSNLDKIFLK